MKTTSMFMFLLLLKVSERMGLYKEITKLIFVKVNMCYFSLHFCRLIPLLQKKSMDKSAYRYINR